MLDLAQSFPCMHAHLLSDQRWGFCGQLAAQTHTNTRLLRDHRYDRYYPISELFASMQNCRRDFCSQLFGGRIRGLRSVVFAFL